MSKALPPIYNPRKYFVSGQEELTSDDYARIYALLGAKNETKRSKKNLYYAFHFYIYFHALRENPPKQKVMAQIKKLCAQSSNILNLLGTAAPISLKEFVYRHPNDAERFDPLRAGTRMKKDWAHAITEIENQGFKDWDLLFITLSNVRKASKNYLKTYSAGVHADHYVRHFIFYLGLFFFQVTGKVPENKKRHGFTRNPFLDFVCACQDYLKFGITKDGLKKQITVVLNSQDFKDLLKFERDLLKR